MIGASIETLRWLASLGAKFARVAPGPTVVAVLATLVSQVAVLLAFFLPLKVLILLGSDGMPRYFPPVFEQFDRDRLVIWLSIATGVFYVLHLLAERVMSASSERGTSLLLQRSQKLVLFENQSEIAGKGYQRYSQALAGGFFSIVAVAAIFFIYLELAILLLAISMLVALIWGGTQFFEESREVLARHLSQFLNIAGAIGFLVVFAYMVLDYLFGSPPGLLLAIISLLLSRQFLTRSAASIMAIVGLHQQRTKLDALFFHGKALLPKFEPVEKGIWALLHPDRRPAWVREVLAELDLEAGNSTECDWFQPVEANTALMRVPGDARLLWVKLYDARRLSFAQHEANLLGEGHGRLIAPSYLGGARVSDSHCHVLATPVGSVVADSDFKAAAERVRTDLLKVEPGSGLVQRYLRSHPLLWQRLDTGVFQRLKIAARPREMSQLEDLIDNLEALSEELKRIPLGVLNPKVTRDSIFVADDGDMLLLDWGRWRLEPVGAGWPVKRIAGLASALEEAAAVRAALATVETRQLELAALTYEILKCCKRQRYVEALGLVPQIRKRIN